MRSPRENLELLRALAAEEGRLRGLTVHGEQEPERPPPPSFPPADESHPVRKFWIAKGMLRPAPVPGEAVTRRRSGN